MLSRDYSEILCIISFDPWPFFSLAWLLCWSLLKLAMIKLILFTESVFMLARSYRINLRFLSQRETGRGRIKWGLFLITYASASTVFVCFSYSLKHSLVSPCSVFPLEKSSNSVNDKQEFGGADSSRPKPSGLAGLGLQMLSQPAFKISPWQQMSLLVRLNFGVPPH